MSSAGTGTAAAAASTATAVSQAPPQAGIFEGLNPAKYNPNDPIVLFTIQASVVIAITRLLYWPLSRIRQPPVIAEVITGIILGPSIMGRIDGFSDTIFPKESMPVFSLAANIGLVFYLFLVGLEIDLRFLVSNWRTAVSVASLDMAIPFGMGYAIAIGIYNEFRDEPDTVQIPFAVFGLFVAVAIAITAFPVLCRILTSLNLLNATVGVITLTSGIANDVIGWVLLALCVTLVNAGNGITALYVLLVSAGYALFLAYAVRPAFMWVLRKTHSLEKGPSQTVVALTVFMVLLSAWFTSIIGAHSVFGAFMIGLVCPHEGGFAIKLTEKLEDMIATLFLPLFFARSGLSTNLALLDTGKTWGYVIAIISIAFASKIFGGTMGARLNGLVWRESATIGVPMSCKGLVELIVLNIGLQAKILSVRTFTMFVVMALVTTFATTPLVSLLYPPSYQRKLELWKQGKIDWDGNSLHHADGASEYDVGKEVTVANPILVYLRADSLSSLFSFLKLFTSASSHPTTSSKPFQEKGVFTGTSRASLQGHTNIEDEHRDCLRVQSLRLSELGERSSSVMKISEQYDTHAGNDPVLKAFGTLAHNSARDVMISGETAFISRHSFAEALATRAEVSRSDFILIPWSESGSLSESPDHAVADIQRGPLANKEFARLVEETFEAAKEISNVGVLIDGTLLKPYIQSASSADNGNVITFSSAKSRPTQIHVFYTGTDDDLFALRLALHLAQNSSVSITIHEESKSSQVMSDTTTFEDLKSHATAIAANPIKLSKFTKSSTFSPELVSSVNNLLLIGRSITSAIGTESSQAQSQDAQRALGTTAVDLIETIRKESGEASVLIVQGKSETTGIRPGQSA